MALAIVTNIGRAHELRGRKLLADFARAYGSTFVATDGAQAAAVDGLAVRDGVVVAVLEAKTRMGYSLYDVQRMGATLLISESKLKGMCEMAKALAVPALLVVEFGDGHRWYWRVADRTGLAACPWNVRRSVTKSDSVGGADVVRDNAFLSLDHGTCWFAPAEQEVVRL
jgi:hypothetical protein